MRGSGVARDLREAAEGSPELAARRKALQEAGLMDRAEYREQLEAANDAAFADGHAVERKAA
jgi:hypothetical protein